MIRRRTRYQYTILSNQMAVKSVLGQPDQGTEDLDGIWYLVVITWTNCREFLPECAEASVTRRTTILWD